MIFDRPQQLLVSIAAALLACSTSLDLEGYGCPCIASYYCNATTNTCMKRGALCDNDDDCPEGFCDPVEGFCRPGGVAACDDGVQNGDETGIDCGGSCPQCWQSLEPDLNAFGSFGVDVAMTAAWIAIGAPQATVNGRASGSVFLYRLNDQGIWEFFLRIDGVEERDRFGQSVALEGDSLLIGIPEEDFNGRSNGGVVEVYEFSDNAWSKQATLTRPSPSSSEWFGTEVALINAIAYVRSDNGYPYPPTDVVDVYARIDGSFQHVQTLEEQGSPSLFGSAFTATADLLVIGAPGAPSSGGAFVYTPQGSAWALEQALLPTGAAFDGSNFGQSVATDGVRIWIGASQYLDAESDTRIGAVLQYEKVDGQWSITQTITAPEREELALFGANIALINDNLLIASPFVPEDQGRISLYTEDEQGVWVHRLDFERPEPEIGGDFATDFAAAGGYVLCNVLGSQPQKAFIRYFPY